MLEQSGYRGIKAVLGFLPAYAMKGALYAKDLTSRAKTPVEMGKMVSDVKREIGLDGGIEFLNTDGARAEAYRFTPFPIDVVGSKIPLKKRSEIIHENPVLSKDGTGYVVLLGYKTGKARAMREAIQIKEGVFPKNPTSGTELWKRRLEYWGVQQPYAVLKGAFR